MIEDVRKAIQAGDEEVGKRSYAWAITHYLGAIARALQVIAIAAVYHKVPDDVEITEDKDGE